jgi:hypothetical protein
LPKSSLAVISDSSPTAEGNLEKVERFSLHVRIVYREQLVEWMENVKLMR